MRPSQNLLSVVLLMIPVTLSGNSAALDEVLACEIRQPRVFTQQSLDALAAEIVAEEEPRRGKSEAAGHNGSRRQFWIVSAWLTAATIYDIESTFYFLGRCGEECHEANPIVRPFIERGRLATYAYSAALNGIILYVARRMYDRGDSWWNVFPVSITLVHGAAGTWNLHRARTEN